jgi:hypothetical protein
MYQKIMDNKLPIKFCPASLISPFYKLSASCNRELGVPITLAFVTHILVNYEYPFHKAKETSNPLKWEGEESSQLNCPT